MYLKYKFSLIFSLSILLVYANNDYELGKKAYERGDYGIAQVYFVSLLSETKHSEHFSDAVYYLTKIFDHKKDFVKFISYANNFLDNYSYDPRCREVFNLLLKRFIENDAFLIAVEYVKKYDYLISDYSMLESLGCGLYRQNKISTAEYILALCPQSDTIKILRAKLNPDHKVRRKIYKSINGIKGQIYLIENYLLIGDTLDAFEVYQTISDADINDDLLYRFAKLALIFEKKDFEKITSRLKEIKGFSNKANILEAMASGHLKKSTLPEDAEDLELFLNFFAYDIISTDPPENIDIDSLLSFEVDTLKTLDDLRVIIKNNYYIDSLYCEMLLHNNHIDDAHRVIVPYFRFDNVRNFVRRVKALKYFKERDYKSAAKCAILSKDESPEGLFLLATSLRALNRDPIEIYSKIMRLTDDSTLYLHSLKDYIKIKFERQGYNEITQFDYETFKGDTTLIRIYLRSLARNGKKARADSILSQYFSEKDYEMINYYGDYLFERKLFNKARSYYDSIIADDIGPQDKIYYNWALVSFLQGEFDTAQMRLEFYIKNFKNGKKYHDALFKIATINYLNENYDSAGYYYGLASKNIDLQSDALQNQLISYKKEGDWSTVIETGEKMLQYATLNDEAKIRFEIGYAFLRSGKVNDAIRNLLFACRSESTPENHYWLGEAYFAKGEFVRALYQYQKIVDQFSRDEMWVPTAQYKTGIVFEFMNDFDEAKKSYRKIVDRWGIKDAIGAEAQKRLEMLQ